MIAFLRRRRAQANHSPWDSQLAAWVDEHKAERAKRTERGWPALRRWLPKGGQS